MSNEISHLSDVAIVCHIFILYSIDLKQRISEHISYLSLILYTANKGQCTISHTAAMLSPIERQMHKPEVELVCTSSALKS